MKIIVLGDTHGRPFWKKILEQDFDIVVFIGDYFDSFDISGEDQIRNFLEIVAFKEANPDKVKLLIGNHDHHYFASVGNTGTSGYQTRMAPSIMHALETYKDLLQMCYKHGEYLFTHAGVSPVWLDRKAKDSWSIDTIEQDINDLWKYKPLSFCFEMLRMSSSITGDNVWQSPIWIRPRSLQDAASLIKKDVIQIVGHTQQYQIDIKGKSTGGRYFYIDTLGTSKEYLIIEDNNIKAAKYE